MENKENKVKEDHSRNDNSIDVIIITSQGDFEYTFDKNDKIQDLIDKTIEKFTFAKNGKYELRLFDDPNEPLIPQRTLVSYHLKDGVKLIFTDLGNAA